MTDELRGQVLARIRKARDDAAAATSSSALAPTFAQALADISELLGDPWLVSGDGEAGPVVVPD